MVYDLYRRRRASLNYEHKDPDDWSHAGFEPADTSAPAPFAPLTSGAIPNEFPVEAEAGLASGVDADARVDATKAKLKSMVEDPDYWQHKKPDAVARVTQAFQAAYGSGNGGTHDATGKLIRTDPNPDAFAAFEETKKDKNLFGTIENSPILGAHRTRPLQATNRDADIGPAVWRGGKIPVRDALYDPKRDGPPNVVRTDYLHQQEQNWPPWADGTNPFQADVAPRSKPTHREAERESYDEYVNSIPPMKWQLPVRDMTSVSSPYGMRMHPILRINKMHEGIDFPAMIGTPVYPADRGYVIDQGESKANGKYVRIFHGNGVESVYLHLDSHNPRWRKGSYISDSDAVNFPIGRSGNSGLSGGPHLHFGMSVDGKPVNPRLYVANLLDRQHKHYGGSR